MLDSFLQFLKFIPAGLLLAAACVEGFVLTRRDRDCEPAVLWLLCCAAVAATVVSVLSFTLYGVRIDPSGLKSGLCSGGIAAAASVAWILKRVARNRSFLLVSELFFDPTKTKHPPKRRPWQIFLLLGYRITLALALLCAVAASLGLPDKSRDGFLSHPEPEGAVVVANTSTLVTGFLNPLAEPLEGVKWQDPTKSEIPSADASAIAAMATSAAMPVTMASTTPSQLPRVLSDQDLSVVAMASVLPSRPVSKNSFYFSKVRPILTKVCVSCHGPQKQKGDLRLDTPDFIRAGVNGKPLIVLGVPAKSRIYHVTGLPADDTDKMPPKGSPLKDSERAVLAEWITNGADLGDGVSIAAGHEGVFLMDAIAANLTAPDPRILEDLKKDHVVIRPLSKNGFVLELDFSHSDRARGDLKLSQLGPIAMNIYALDFSRTHITDADLRQLIPMKNLSRLLLSRTDVSDAGLSLLHHHFNLEQLNLYNTRVTDVGLASLSRLKSLKKVYLWQSEATAEGAKQLQQQVPGLVVSMGQ